MIAPMKISAKYASNIPPAISNIGRLLEQALSQRRRIS
jgi:hypothetical protein